MNHTYSIRALHGITLCSMFAGCAAPVAGELDADAPTDNVTLVSQGLGGTTSANYTALEAIIQIEQHAARGEGADEVCTGTLIGPRTILTAAHCVVPARPTDIYRGDDLKNGMPPFATATRIWVDPEFSARPVAHDVALIRLEADAPMTPLNLRGNALAEGQWVALVGYGNSTDGVTGRHSGMAQIGSTVNDVVHTQGMSAYACKGDSGGPVLSWRNPLDLGTYRVSGIMSWGAEPCAMPTTTDIVPVTNMGRQLQELLLEGAITIDND